MANTEYFAFIKYINLKKYATNYAANNLVDMYSFFMKLKKTINKVLQIWKIKCRAAHCKIPSIYEINSNLVKSA